LALDPVGELTSADEVGVAARERASRARQKAGAARARRMFLRSD